MSRIWDALKQAERERSGARISDDSHRAPIGGPERRKGLRHSYAAQLLVYGSGADKQPFHEHVETIDANDEGCLFDLEAPVREAQRLFLIHPRTQAEQECRVVRVGKRLEGKARVAVAFGSPAPDFWRRE